MCYSMSRHHTFNENDDIILWMSLISFSHILNSFDALRFRLCRRRTSKRYTDFQQHALTLDYVFLELIMQ